MVAANNKDLAIGGSFGDTERRSRSDHFSSTFDRGCLGRGKLSSNPPDRGFSPGSAPGAQAATSEASRRFPQGLPILDPTGFDWRGGRRASVCCGDTAAIRVTPEAPVPFGSPAASNADASSPPLGGAGPLALPSQDQSRGAGWRWALPRSLGYRNAARAPLQRPGRLHQRSGYRPTRQRRGGQVTRPVR